MPAASLENGDDLYGHSMAMRDVMALIARAAGMRAGVLIRGEEGTGRQVAARAIHALQRAATARSSRSIARHSTATELDAELFGSPARGHNSDASRPASSGSAGSSRLHHARGGTLYLQNVAEAPTRVQARLARLLRDREAILTETGDAVDFDIRRWPASIPASTPPSRTGACARICSGACR